MTTKQKPDDALADALSVFPTVTEQTAEEDIGDGPYACAIYDQRDVNQTMHNACSVLSLIESVINISRDEITNDGKYGAFLVIETVRDALYRVGADLSAKERSDMLQARGDSDAELLDAIIRHCENGISCVFTAIQSHGVCLATDLKDRPDHIANDIGWTIHMLGSLAGALDHVRSDTEIDVAVVLLLNWRSRRPAQHQSIGKPPPPR